VAASLSRAQRGKRTLDAGRQCVSSTDAAVTPARKRQRPAPQQNHVHCKQATGSQLLSSTACARWPLSVRV
jgi:hypothetical protein